MGEQVTNTTITITPPVDPKTTKTEEETGSNKTVIGNYMNGTEPLPPGSQPEQPVVDYTQQNQTKLLADNNATQAGTANKHKESDIEDAFKPIFNKYNLNYDKDFVSKLFHNGLDSILNIDVQEKFDWIINITKIALEKALEKHYDPKTKTVDLEKVAETALEYKRAMIFGGWNDLDAYERAKDEYTYIDKNRNKKPITITVAIKFELKLGYEEDLSNKSQEELESLVTQYFDKKFKEFKAQTNDDIKAAHLLRQHMAVLMANSSDEERALLGKTVRKYVHESEQLQEYFHSMKDPKLRAQVADGYDAGDLMKLDKECIEIIISNMSGQKAQEMDEHAKAELRVLLDEHKEELENAIAKKNAGEELTPDEARYLEQFEKLTGIRIGVNNNKNIDNETLDQINQDWEALLSPYNNIYIYHLEEIRRFIQEHADLFNMSTEEFESLMDEYTNGEYSTVVSNMSDSDEPTSYNTDSCGYTNTDVVTYNNALYNASNLHDAIAETSDDRDSNQNRFTVTPNDGAPTAQPTGQGRATITNSKGMQAYADSNKMSKAQVFAGIIKDQIEATKELVIDYFKTHVDNALKGAVVANASSKWSDVLMAAAPIEAIANYLDAGGKGRSLYETNMMREAVNEEKEKNLA